MAQLIEFPAVARITPTVNWPPHRELGKVIPFMSRREESLPAPTQAAAYLPNGVVDDESVCSLPEQICWDESSFLN